MRIITTTYEDFVNAEIAENGYDWVEGKFLLGYEPCFKNGIWCWCKPEIVISLIGTSTLTT